MNTDLNILFLCKKFPYPLRDGESIAVHNLTKSLAKNGCKISLLCLNTSKHTFDVSTLPGHVDQYSAIHTVDIDTKINAKGAFKNLFSKESYHISRFNSPEFKSKLIDLLNVETFDLVQLETLTMAIYLPEIKLHSKAAVVMRAHNVEYQIWDRLSDKITSPIRRSYIKYLSRKLKRFELAQLKKYDLLLTVSENDLKHFAEQGYTGASQVVPIGIDMEKYTTGTQGNSKDLFFIGSMDWMPNAYGLNWFMDEVWQSIFNELPNMRLHVAGRNSQSLEAKAGVENHGEVDSALDFMSTHGIMIVPLFSGSGTRVKIIEGLALGKVIISTGIGAEGIDVVDGKHIIIANTKEEFVQAVKRCMEKPLLLEEISQAARMFVEKNYDGDVIAQKLIPIYKKHLNNTAKV